MIELNTKKLVMTHLEELTYLPLGNILKNLDGDSAINLANSSPVLRCNIETYLDGNTGCKYWTEHCKNWYTDPALMTVIASYDTIIGRRRFSKREIHEKEKKLNFSWDYAYRAAHDIVNFIRRGEISRFHLKKLRDQIVGDICIKYGMRNLHYAVPNRVTGTSGSLVWNVTCPSPSEDNRETVFIYENMTKCKRMMYGRQQQVHEAQLITLHCQKSLAEMERAVSYSLFPVLSRFLLTVSDTRICVIPLQEGALIEVDLPEYSFSKIDDCVFMRPKVAIYDNYFAVWSSPYSLKVYSMQVGTDGCLEVTLYADLAASKQLGKLWVRRAELSKKCDYAFSLERLKFKSAFADHTLMISITCPIDPKNQMYQITVKRGINTTKEVEVVTQQLQCYPQVQYEEVKSLYGGKSAHGLHIYWNEDFLAASKNGVQWFFQEWMTFGLENDPESFDATLVEIIAPNILVVVSGEDIYVVMISLNEQDESSSSFSPFITMKLVRKISTGFFQRGLAIRQLGLDYDRGTPYIWLEVDKVCLPSDVSSYKMKNKPWSFQFFTFYFVNN